MFCAAVTRWHFFVKAITGTWFIDILQHYPKYKWIKARHACAVRDIIHYGTCCCLQNNSTSVSCQTKRTTHYITYSFWKRTYHYFWSKSCNFKCLLTEFCKIDMTLCGKELQGKSSLLEKDWRFNSTAKQIHTSVEYFFFFFSRSSPPKFIDA